VLSEVSSLLSFQDTMMGHSDLLDCLDAHEAALCPLKPHLMQSVYELALSRKEGEPALGMGCNRVRQPESPIHDAADLWEILKNCWGVIMGAHNHADFCSHQARPGLACNIRTASCMQHQTCQK